MKLAILRLKNGGEIVVNPERVTLEVDAGGDKVTIDDGRQVHIIDGSFNDIALNLQYCAAGLPWQRLAARLVKRKADILKEINSLDKNDPRKDERRGALAEVLHLQHHLNEFQQ